MSFAPRHVVLENLTSEEKNKLIVSSLVFLSTARLQTPQPGQVTGLSATAGNQQISLSWNAVSSAPAVFDYRVEYKLSSNTVWLVFADGTSTATNVVVTGLTNNSSYDFRVSATNNSWTGTPSTTVTATPISPPGQVTGLVATAGNSQISLTWTAVVSEPPVTDYLVEYKLTSSGTWLTFSDNTSTSASAVVTNLTNNSSYDFRVSAINLAGTGTPSTTVSATPINTTPTATNMSAPDVFTINTTKSLTPIVVTEPDAGQRVCVVLTPSTTSAVSSFTVVAAGGVRPTYNDGIKRWAVTGPVSGVNACLAIVQYVPASNFSSIFSISTALTDIGDVIKLDFSSASDGAGGSLADWNSVTSNTTLTSLKRHGDGAIVSGVSVSFTNMVNTSFGADASGTGWTGQSADPYYINAVAQDIYYHGVGTTMSVTFSGLTPARFYTVRVYALLSTFGTTVDTFTIVGLTTQTISNTRATRWSATTLEAGGTVFTTQPTVGGQITIQAANTYPLNAIVLECGAVIPVTGTKPMISFSGAQIWLDGTDPLGTGTPPTNGASVTTWTDKSGNNRHFIASVVSGAVAPTYQSTALGAASNKGAVRFSGSNNRLVRGSDTSPTTTMTLCAYIKNRSTTTDQLWIGSRSNVGGKYQVLRFSPNPGYGTSPVIMQFNGNTNGVTSGMWWEYSSSANPTCYIMQQNGTTGTMRINGTVPNLSAFGRTSMNNEPHLYGILGTLTDGPGSCFCDFGFLAIFPSVLTTTQCELLEAYIANLFA